MTANTLSELQSLFNLMALTDAISMFFREGTRLAISRYFTRSSPTVLITTTKENFFMKNKSSNLLSVLWQRAIRFYWLRFSVTKQHRWETLSKRLFDIIVSALLLLAISPVLIVTMLAIKINSEGNVFFTQERVGLNGRHFWMWKFRSMYIDAEQRKAELFAQNEMTGGVIFKMKRDPRITAVGRFIRRTSIDELPQLWNVLIGDMSLVGPRPALPKEVALYTPYQRQRLSVLPGITCIWQVSGRSEIPFVQQVEMDLQYIATQSFLGDLKLLLKTIPAVFFGKGAY